MQSLVFCLAVLQITQARNIFIQFYIIYILWKAGLAPGKEKSPKDDIDVMIKTILNITEICDLMQNTDQVSLVTWILLQKQNRPRLELASEWDRL